MTRRPRLVWQADPTSAHGLPLAAVVRLPQGPALAKVEAIGRSGDRLFRGLIDGREVTGMHGSAAACRKAIADVVERAHQAAARRRADAE